MGRTLIFPHFFTSRALAILWILLLQHSTICLCPSLLQALWFTPPSGLGKTTAPVLSVHLSTILNSSSCHPSDETHQWLPAGLDYHSGPFLALSISPACSGPCPALYPTPNPLSVLTKLLSCRVPSISSITSFLPARNLCTSLLFTVFFHLPSVLGHSPHSFLDLPSHHVYIPHCLYRS